MITYPLITYLLVQVRVFDLRAADAVFHRFEPDPQAARTRTRLHTFCLVPWRPLAPDPGIGNPHHRPHHPPHLSPLSAATRRSPLLAPLAAPSLAAHAATVLGRDAGDARTGPGDPPPARPADPDPAHGSDGRRLPASTEAGGGGGEGEGDHSGEMGGETGGGGREREAWGGAAVSREDARAGDVGAELWRGAGRGTVGATGGLATLGGVATAWSVAIGRSDGNMQVRLAVQVTVAAVYCNGCCQLLSRLLLLVMA